jgi:hypothetical protein
MGLGIREGIITLGLSNLISVATAGFLSIFSRIVLIISELIFVMTVSAFEIAAKVNKR